MHGAADDGFAVKSSKAFVPAWAGFIALTAYAWLSDAPGFTLAAAIGSAIVLGVAVSHSSCRMLAGPVTILCIVAGLTYIVRPLALVAGSPSFASRLDRSQLDYALAISLVFLTALVVGIWSSGRHPDPVALSAPPAKAHARLGLALVVAVAISLAAYSANCRLVGFSLAEPFLDPVNFRSATGANGQYYVTAVAVNFAWLPYWITLIYRAPSEGRRSAFQMVYLGLAFGFAAVMSVPYGQRSYFLTPVVGTLWFVESRGYRLRLKRLIPIALVVILGTGYYGAYRELNSNSVSGGLDNVSLALDSGTGKALSSVSSRFDSFDFLAQTLQTWNGPYHYGRSLLDFAAQPLPRSLYPDKPPQTSFLLISQQQPEVGSHFTPEYGLATELYINGGIIGVGLGGLAFGALIARIGRIRATHISRSHCLVLAPLVFLPAYWFLSGLNSFASVTAVFSVMISIVGAWLVRIGPVMPVRELTSPIASAQSR